MQNTKPQQRNRKCKERSNGKWESGKILTIKENSVDELNSIMDGDTEEKSMK